MTHESVANNELRPKEIGKMVCCKSALWSSVKDPAHWRVSPIGPSLRTYCTANPRSQYTKHYYRLPEHIVTIVAQTDSPCMPDAEMTWYKYVCNTDCSKSACIISPHCTTSRPHELSTTIENIAACHYRYRKTDIRCRNWRHT